MKMQLVYRFQNCKVEQLVDIHHTPTPLTAHPGYVIDGDLLVHSVVSSLAHTPQTRVDHLVVPVAWKTALAM